MTNEGVRMRTLDEQFITALKDGILSPILKFVQNDDTLCLAIRRDKRSDFINIYYRGGSLMRITPTVPEAYDSFNIEFNLKGTGKKNSSEEQVGEDGGSKGYADSPLYDAIINLRDVSHFPPSPRVVTSEDAKVWCNHIPLIKTIMDGWFAKNPKSEREFQQLILRENNRGKIARDTNYYFSDLEYSDEESGGRFDMLALHQTAQRPNFDRVALVEVKYGDGALKKESGLVEHAKKMYSFLTRDNGEKARELADEALEQYLQLDKLGLINKKARKSDQKLRKGINFEIIFILINHQAASTTLLPVLKEVLSVQEKYRVENKNGAMGIEIKIAKSSGMGYGLYDECFCTLEKFIEELEQNLKSK